MATKHKRAVAAAQRGDHEAAVPLYLGAMKLLPMLQNDPPTWRALQAQLGSSMDHVARSRWAAGRLDEAVVMQREAVGLIRNSALAYSNLGAYLTQKHGSNSSSGERDGGTSATHGGTLLREAEAALESALKLQPTHDESLLQLLRARYLAVMERRYGVKAKDKKLTLDALHSELSYVLRRPPHAERALRALCPLASSAAEASVPDATRLRAAAAEAADVQLVDEQDGTQSERLLGAWVDDPDQLEAARRALISNRPHTLSKAFSEAFAHRMHKLLEGSTSDQWDCHSEEDGVRQAGNGTFWMRRCVGGTALQDAIDPALLGEPLKRLVAEITGEEIGGETIAQPTYFRQGDFLTLHNDAGAERVVAFAWHLNLQWQPGDGGELAFACAEEGGEKLIPPRFNSLTLFRVHGLAATSDHAVLPVVSDVPDQHRRRYAISGWFTTRTQGAPPSRQSEGGLITTAATSTSTSPESSTPTEPVANQKGASRAWAEAMPRSSAERWIIREYEPKELRQAWQQVRPPIGDAALQDMEAMDTKVRLVWKEKAGREMPWVMVAVSAALRGVTPVTDDYKGLQLGLYEWRMFKPGEEIGRYTGESLGVFDAGDGDGIAHALTRLPPGRHDKVLKVPKGDEKVELIDASSDAGDRAPYIQRANDAHNLYTEGGKKLQYTATLDEAGVMRSRGQKRTSSKATTTQTAGWAELLEREVLWPYGPTFWKEVDERQRKQKRGGRHD